MRRVKFCDTKISNNISFSEEEFFTIKTFITGLLDEGPLFLYDFEHQYYGRELTSEECWDLLFLLKESNVKIPVVIKFMKLLEFVSLIGAKLLII